MIPNIEIIDNIFKNYIDLTDFESEYRAALPLYWSRRCSLSARIFRNMIAKDFELVELTREIIRDTVPEAYGYLNNNLGLFKDSLRTVSSYIETKYIDAGCDKQTRKAAKVLLVRLWEIILFSDVAEARDIWNEYDRMYSFTS